jgi:hypothetical protein
MIEIGHLEFLRDFPNIVMDLNKYLGKYYNLCINLYSLCMHRIVYHTDDEFESYECDENTKVGRIYTKLGCDDILYMRHHKKHDAKLKIVLTTLFGEGINKYIKDSPDKLKPPLEETESTGFKLPLKWPWG